jgi:hypothetical protein
LSCVADYDRKLETQHPVVNVLVLFSLIQTSQFINELPDRISFIFVPMGDRNENPARVALCRVLALCG